MLRIKLKNNKYHSISCILYFKWSILTHFYHATFYLISNKAEAEGKFGWSRDWHMLFNFARFPAILWTESANRLICFWCTSTKRTVWVQNEVEEWDFRSRTRGQYMTTDVCKFVKKWCGRRFKPISKNFADKNCKILCKLVHTINWVGLTVMASVKFCLTTG